MSKRPESNTVRALRATYERWADGDFIPVNTAHDRMLVEILGQDALGMYNPDPVPGQIGPSEELPLFFGPPDNPADAKRTATVVRQLYEAGWFTED